MIRGKVGPWEIEFKSSPRGPQGSVQAEIRGPGVTKAESIELRWRRDPDGLWLETPRGVFGFDFQGEAGDDGRTLFSVSERESDAAYSGLTFSRGGEEAAAAASAGVKKGMRVRAQMPGKIIRVLTRVGAMVEKDQPLLVMEAMKMENEIRASQSGKVSALKVAEGQAVETGADLCVIDPV